MGDTVFPALGLPVVVQRALVSTGVHIGRGRSRGVQCWHVHMGSHMWTSGYRVHNVHNAGRIMLVDGSALGVDLCSGCRG